LDEEGKPVTKGFGDLLDLVDSQNKEVRDASAKALNEIFAKHVDVAEHELNSILQDKKVNDELRGLDRPDKVRHISDDLESDVVDTLIATVSARNSLAQRYYALKAKLMGVNKLAYHERNVPLGNLNIKYPYQKAVEIVKNTFADLDRDFAEIFTDMVAKGQLDVFPMKGKYAGAFCTHKRLGDPSYVLLNHTDRLSDVLTIAHEMGHAINNYLIARTQNALNNDTPLSTAEVASTFMEDFAFERVSLDYTDGDKLYLIMEKLGDDISTIFRQVACYRFEQELHKSYRKKNYLTQEEIGTLFLKHMHAYMGNAVEQSAGSQNWWVYWSHIRSFFYVYSYSSGQLISKALQSMVRRDKSEIAKVKKFLAAGLSEPPKKLFLDMGIDITDAGFWNKGLDEVEELLNQAESLALQPRSSS
jgi:oligoendopeptidase F